MPQFSVKIASNTTSARHGASQFLASNLVLGANEILCRPTGSSSLLGRTIQQIAADTNGISYFRTISDGTTNTVITGNGPHILALVPGPRISITPEYNGGTGTAQFTITSHTVLSSDATPKLGANLNTNGFSFSQDQGDLGGMNAVVLRTTQTYAAATTLFSFTVTHSDTASSISLTRDSGVGATRDLTIAGFGPTSGVIIDRIKSSNAGTAIELASASSSISSLSVRHILLGSANTAEVIMGCAAKDFVLTSTGRSTTTSSAIRNRLWNSANLIGDLVVMGTGNNTAGSIAIASSNVGNLILVANNTTVTTGTIPSSGGASVQFNSDILLSAKSIKAVDNNITIDTVTNNFTGSLKLKATSKSGFHRVKSGQRVNGTASSKILETVSTTSNTEKFSKYMLYMQDTLDPAACALIEFNVLANGTSARGLQTCSIIVNDSTGDLGLFDINGNYNIIVLSSAAGTLTTNSGETITDAQVSSICNSNNPTESVNTFLIKFNDCLFRDYNYTLYKMSIEA